MKQHCRCVNISCSSNPLTDAHRCTDMQSLRVIYLPTAAGRSSGGVETRRSPSSAVSFSSCPPAWLISPETKLTKQRAAPLLHQVFSSNSG